MSDHPTCPQCEHPMIRVEECVIGFPDHHVEGSRLQYCGTCDEPPVVTLDSRLQTRVLVPNQP